MRNIRKKISGGDRIVTIILVLLAFISLSRGVAGIAGLLSGKPLAEQTHQSQMEETGGTLAGRELEQARAMDARLEQNARRMKLTGCAASLLAAVVFLAAGMFAWRRYADPARTRFGRMAAKYTAVNGVEDVRGALKEINRELDSPDWTAKQFTLTRHWAIGWAGMTRKPVCIPLRAVVGVYAYSPVRRTLGRPNSFYQVILADRFDTPVILRLGNRRQMEDVCGMLRRACPNARGGNYDDYIAAYCGQPREQRLEECDRIFRANVAAGI